MNTRNCFLIDSAKVSTLKCYYGFNHYAARDRIVNHRLVNKECLQYSRKEDWDHIVQCRKTFNLKVDFIINIKAKLIKAKHESITEEVIDLIIKDIR